VTNANAWIVELTKNAGGPSTGYRVAITGGSGALGSVQVNTCPNGGNETVYLHNLGDTVDVTCVTTTSSLSGTYLRVAWAQTFITFSKKKFFGGSSYQLYTNWSQTLGSPATAGTENTGAIEAEVIDAADMAVGSFALDAGESIDIEFTTETTVEAFVLVGSVTLTVGGRSVTLEPGAASVTLSLDTTAPEITTPATVTLEATSPAGAFATFETSATDDFDGAVPVNCSPPTGSTFGLGATTVTCTARDRAGNVAERTFIVSVIDTTAPTVIVPGGIATDATSPSGAVVTFTAKATDAVSGPLAVTCTPSSGSTFAVGNTTVTCTAADAASNVGSATFVIHVSGAGEQIGVTRAAVEASTQTPSGLRASLLASLDAALASLDRGTIGSAKNELHAFINKVQAQSGKQIPTAFATELVNAAKREIAVLGG
jgi:hypothetical protein